MTHYLICLLTLLVSLNSPAMEGNADFWHSPLAAKATARTFTSTDPMLEDTGHHFKLKTKVFKESEWYPVLLH